MPSFKSSENKRVMTIEKESYDLICIGSGMGTLAVSSLLARFAGKKVLMIEKHFQPGGYTHAFSRKQGKFHWDVGIHYVGDMQEGGFCRKLMDAIVEKKVAWNQMPEPFEKFVYPEETFSLYGEKERFQNDLVGRFPDEKSGIDQYFKDIARASAQFGKSMLLKWSQPPLESLGVREGDAILYTLKEYLDFRFQNPLLKAILASQWGDYGLPPSKCSFATHASLVVHYLNGGYYPVGGAGKIFEAVEPIIQKAGGKVLSSTEVKEILVEDGKAIGVRTLALRGEKEEKSYYAPIIVSGAGALLTYLKLVPESVQIPFRDSLRDFYRREKMATSLCVYMGLSESPAKLGFRGENYWIFDSTDHDKNYSDRNEWLDDKGEIKNLYLSFPSLKDPEAKSHTADLITFTDYSLFEAWKDRPWKKRGDDYKELKDKIALKVVDFLEKRFPGFRSIIEYMEVSTPITNEYFTSHPDGAIYGLACVPERYDKSKSPWFDVQTPISGLYLTGADAGGSPGIAGAMMGGLATTLRIMGKRDLLKTILE